MQDPTGNRPTYDSPVQPFRMEIPWVERVGMHPFLFSFLSLCIVFILYQIIGGVLSLLLFGITPTPEDLTGYRIVTGLSQLLFIFMPTLILVRLATYEPGKFLRLSAPAIKPVIVSIFSVISLEMMLQIFLAFQEKLPLPEALREMMDQFKQFFEELYKYLLASASVPEFLFVVVIVAVIPAVAEEFLFRGLIQRSVEKKTTPYRGAIITGIIFGAYHLNPYSFVPLAAIGIFLGFLTVRTGSIWTSVIAHFMNNFMACLAIYHNLDDDFVGFGGAKTMSNEMLLFSFWVFGLIFLISVLYLLRITKMKEEDINKENHDSSINSGVGK